MFEFHWISSFVFAADLLIRVGLSLRVIRRRLPVGVSLAWLAIILVFPFAGAILYLLLGEYRLGPARGRRAIAYKKVNRGWLGRTESAYGVDPGALSPSAAALARLAQSTLGSVPLSGNALKLLENAEAAFPVLIADIDAAQRTCFMEFYIWSNGGVPDDVAAALIRAAARGVDCRLLVDALGSKAFLASPAAANLRRKGVHVEAALQSGLLRLLFVRPDLRMHRKNVVIDGVIGYTGSLNLADPRFFKQDAGVGQWVDAFARVQGPAVDVLAEMFREDWYLETGQLLDPSDVARIFNPSSTPAGQAVLQVLPTGPGAHVDAIEQLVLMALYTAKSEVVLTTPYFVPSESLLTALLSAAGRGVSVTLIVPAKVDSRLVHFASRAFQTDLLKAGVCVALFTKGLLHTKSITVDGALSLFGSVNLDPRSMRLDLEITLAVYDAEFTAALRRLQNAYLKDAVKLDLAACASRSGLEVFAEDAARLVGPVL